MPRVHYRKARKDYPSHGIEAGEMYYTAKIKQQRGGITLRSKTPLKPSQLTTSPFKSAYLAAGEAWEESAKDAEAIRDVASAIREAGEEAQNSFDNMPEGLQMGETGQMLENRANECESKADELEGLADELEGLEEPVEPDAVDEPDDDEAPDFAAKTDAFETYQDLLSEYEDLLSEYESEQERIPNEAGDLISDMPE